MPCERLAIFLVFVLCALFGEGGAAVPAQCFLAPCALRISCPFSRVWLSSTGRISQRRTRSTDGAGKLQGLPKKISSDVPGRKPGIGEAEDKTAGGSSISASPTPEQMENNVTVRDMWSFTRNPPDLRTGGVNDVASFRHNEYGTGLELWQGSFGWFDFINTDDGEVILCDSWAVQMRRNSKKFSQHEQFDTLSAQDSDPEKYRLDGPVQMGAWTIEYKAGLIQILNKHSKRQRIFLTCDGMIFVGARGKAVRVLKGEVPQDVDVFDILELLPTS